MLYKHTISAALIVATALVIADAPSADANQASKEWRKWTGEPAMISNLGVYRDSEFIYQDYIYDDHGPNTDGIDHTDAIIGGTVKPSDPTNPTIGSTGGQIRYAGDFMYASPDGRHYDNVADLIEFRVAESRRAVHYLIRLGALVEPDSTVVGICADEDLRTDTGLSTWPFGAGLTQQLGCDRFYTVHGTGAFVTDGGGDSKPLSSLGGDVRYDLEANTLEVRVPLSVADPGGDTWRYYVGSGLWDKKAWRQVPPGPQVIGAPTPTGGGVGVPQLWDLLSNNDEPNTYWREEKQANDLTGQDIADHHVDVSFERLASGVNDGKPRVTGVVDRIYVSRYPMEPNEGIGIANPVTRNFVYHGPYQPYSMVIPSTYWKQLDKDPGKRFDLDLCLHPLNGNHHVEIYYAEAQARRGYNPVVTGTVPSTGYLGYTVYPNLYDRLNKLYACVNGRGEAVGYKGGDGLVDLLEVTKDIQKRYRVDEDQTTLHGISLGAIGTWYVSQLYPDRYSAAMPYIFSPGFGGDNPLFPNLYNLPVFYVIGQGDQFGQGAFGDDVADQLEALGNEYVYYHHLDREHELSLGDEALPFTIPLMYSRERVENPARVRYVFDPGRFSPKIPGEGQAYWVSGMDPRRSGEPASIDVTSLGRADQLPRDQVVFDGVYANTVTGAKVRFRGLLRVTPERFEELWRPADFEAGWQEVTPLQVDHTELPTEKKGNGFQFTTENLGEVDLDAGRMRINPRETITSKVEGDGTLRLTLLGSFPESASATLDGKSVPVSVTGAGITLTLALKKEPQTLRISRAP